MNDQASTPAPGGTNDPNQHVYDFLNYYTDFAEPPKYAVLIGTYIPTPHPTQRFPSYAFGGTEALDLREVYRLSRKEFDQAVRVFGAYCELLRELLAALPSDEATNA